MDQKGLRSTRLRHLCLGPGRSTSCHHQVSRRRGRSSVQSRPRRRRRARLCDNGSVEVGEFCVCVCVCTSCLVSLTQTYMAILQIKICKWVHQKVVTHTGHVVVLLFWPTRISVSCHSLFHLRMHIALPCIFVSIHRTDCRPLHSLAHETRRTRHSHTLRKNGF